jgi:hypothetical protein
MKAINSCEDKRLINRASLKHPYCAQKLNLTATVEVRVNQSTEWAVLSHPVLIPLFLLQCPLWKYNNCGALCRSKCENMWLMEPPDLLSQLFRQTTFEFRHEIRSFPRIFISSYPKRIYAHRHFKSPCQAVINCLMLAQCLLKKYEECFRRKSQVLGEHVMRLNNIDITKSYMFIYIHIYIRNSAFTELTKWENVVFLRFQILFPLIRKQIR